MRVSFKRDEFMNHIQFMFWDGSVSQMLVADNDDTVEFFAEILRRLKALRRVRIDEERAR